MGHNLDIENIWKTIEDDRTIDTFLAKKIKHLVIFLSNVSSLHW